MFSDTKMLLVKLADLADEITLEGSDSRIPITVVREIFRRKCGKLQIYEGPDDSVPDIELLIQVVNIIWERGIANETKLSFFSFSIVLREDSCMKLIMLLLILMIIHRVLLGHMLWTPKKAIYLSNI